MVVIFRQLPDHFFSRGFYFLFCLFVLLSSRFRLFEEEKENIDVITIPTKVIYSLFIFQEDGFFFILLTVLLINSTISQFLVKENTGL